MKTVLCCLAVLASLYTLPRHTCAQDQPPATTAPATTAPADLAEQTRQLDRFRAFIENVADSEPTRIAHAEDLLTSDWPGADDLAVSLLTTGNEPSTKIIVARAISNIGRRDASLLKPELVQPLIALLASSSSDVAQQAGQALAAFSDHGVADMLSGLVANADAPMQQRLAALAALTPNTQRHAVVAELVELLDSKDPEIVSRVIPALERVSRVSYGNDIAAWKQWWADQSALSETDWLRDQLDIQTQRLREAEQTAAQQLAEQNQHRTQLADRLSQALAAQYRLVPQAEREPLVLRWFADTTPETRRIAASLVAEQISEGNLPSDGLRTALRERFNDDSPLVRKLVIEVVGALNEPADAKPLLARLAVEQDDLVRETILRILGKLRNPDALEPLLTELDRKIVSDRCLAAAADALGMLCSRDPLAGDFHDALVATLKQRLTDAAGRSRDVRIALLGAMAAIGAQEFKPEFEAGLLSDDPEVLLRAIQGVSVVGNGEQMTRLTNLLVHPDARVRQRALEAMGALGDESQLAAIAARLSPGSEPVEGPRQAAWQAFNQIAKRLPISRQVAAADNLTDYPAYAAEYLKRLHDEMTAMKPAPPELPAIRERLALTYRGLGRNCEALPYWRQLYTEAVQSGDPRVYELALRQLQSTLRCDKTDRLDVDLGDLADAPSDLQEQAVNAVIAYLQQPRTPEQAPQLEATRTTLHKLPPETFPALTAYLKSTAPPATQPANPSPNPSRARQETD